MSQPANETREPDLLMSPGIAAFAGFSETLNYRDVISEDDETGAESLSPIKTETFQFRPSINAGVLLAATAMNGASRNAQGTGAVFDLLSAACRKGEYERMYDLINHPDKRVSLDDLIALNVKLLEAYSGGRPTSRPAS